MPEFDPFDTLEEGIAYAESAGVNEMTMLRATVAPSMKAALDILRGRTGLSPIARTEIETIRNEMERFVWFTAHETQDEFITKTFAQKKAWIAALDSVLGAESTKEAGNG